MGQRTFYSVFLYFCLIVFWSVGCSLWLAPHS